MKRDPERAQVIRQYMSRVIGLLLIEVDCLDLEAHGRTALQG